jgi:hypothetical protein
MIAKFKPVYTPWRHGGWYVVNVRYPNGACGCVSNNYEDKKWRIVCDDREGDHTYKTREAAAIAEWEIAQKVTT